MISVKVDSKTGRLDLIASGSALDLLVETSAVIGTVYAQLMKGSPEIAQAYREALVEGLADPESAVWDVSGDGRCVGHIGGYPCPGGRE